MKIIDSTVQALLDGKTYGAVLLGQFDFGDSSGPLKLNSSSQTVYWDDTGSGEVPYIGIGNLASISTLTETTDLGVIQVQFTLSGIPPENLTDAFSDDYRNNSVYLWYGLLNTDTYAIQGGTGGPVLVYAGLMDYCTIDFGKTANITLNTTSRLADWDRARGGRFNKSYQQTYVDSTDSAFDRVTGLQFKTVTWGGFIDRAGSAGGDDRKRPDQRREPRG